MFFVNIFANGNAKATGSEPVAFVFFAVPFVFFKNLILQQTKRPCGRQISADTRSFLFFISL